MADEADLAFDVEQQTLSSAIAAQLKKKTHLHPGGICHYCDTAVNKVQLFCDSACAADWERIERQRKAIGL